MCLTLTPATAFATTTEPAEPEAPAAEAMDLTILASTDLHGTALDYDYFVGEPFGASDREDTRGMEYLSTAISSVRAEVGAESVLLVDNGDANQGNSLETVYHANNDGTVVDPMASVFNHLGYDTGTVGNHEFNYDLDVLKQYEDSLEMPLLGANVIDVATGEPFHTPYTMVEKVVGGETVTVGILGLVTPGVRNWDRQFVEGKLEFKDLVQTAQEWVPVMKSEGADVVVVLSHSGLDAEGYQWDPSHLTENISKSLAENVSDIDVIIGGHSHVEDKVQEYFVNPDGREVLYSQPGYHARFLSQVTVPLTVVDGDVAVEWTETSKPTAQALHAYNYDADPAIAQVIAPWHDQTVEWVNQVVAQATEDMPAATSRYEDTAILDFINHVQIEELERALAGTEWADRPIIAEVSPFSRTAVFSEGDVTVADMAAIYVYDNTLYGIEVTGAEVKEYLEWSARYYTQQEEDAVIENWDDVTNALYPGATRGVQDYAYDVLSGVNYHINISKPVGERIENLTHPDGTPVADDDLFAFALNNYRQGGGSGYPVVQDAPVIYNEQKAIRDLMIDWAIERGTIDPAEFFEVNWTVSTSTVLETEEPVDPEEPEEPGVPEEPAFERGFLLDTDSDRVANSNVIFGRSTDEVFVGDWTGHDIDTVGVRRGAEFHLKRTNAPGLADIQFVYGRAADTVLVGDWDGDGIDTFAVVRGNNVFVRNSLSAGLADETFNYGRSTDTYLAGDWNGDGTDTLGVRRGNVQILSDNNRTEGYRYTFGRTGDVPIVGDFDGDSIDAVGVQRGNSFYLNNSNTAAVAAEVVVVGRAGDTPLVGDFDGNGVDDLGVHR